MDNLTIADISMASNISLTEIKGYRLDAWPDLATWYQRMKAQPWWPECNKGLYHHFQQYFSYIVAVSFIGGGNRSTRRRIPLTCLKFQSH
jgi:hypothetical protein